MSDTNALIKTEMLINIKHSLMRYIHSINKNFAAFLSVFCSFLKRQTNKTSDFLYSSFGWQFSKL